MRKVHEKVVGKFLQQEKIRTANFSVTNHNRWKNEETKEFGTTSVLYSYALPVAIIDSNGNIFVGDYIRQISNTTSAQIRALVSTLNSLRMDYKMLPIAEFKELVWKTI
jgi:hypothetical protein